MASLRTAAVVRDVTDACRRLLDDLEPAALARATFAFDAPERRAWHYIPMDRPGLQLGDLAESQHAVLDRLLGSVLSPEGVATARAIIDNELTLRALEEQEGTAFLRRDPALYTFIVFGAPGTAPWGWRLEGHHLSLNVTVAGPEAIAVLPAFFGANPAEVRFGDKAGLRILAKLEDLARALVRSFDDAQLARARIADEAPWDIVSVNAPVLEPGPPEGLPVADMSAGQKDGLRVLLSAYAQRWIEPLKEDLLQRIEAQLDGVYLAWAGSVEPGAPHYYRIQGPTLYLEYVNTQNEANHIHTIWRDVELDFGGT